MSCSSIRVLSGALHSFMKPPLLRFPRSPISPGPSNSAQPRPGESNGFCFRMHRNCLMLGCARRGVGTQAMPRTRGKCREHFQRDRLLFGQPRRREVRSTLSEAIMGRQGPVSNYGCRHSCSGRKWRWNLCTSRHVTFTICMLRVVALNSRVRTTSNADWSPGKAIRHRSLPQTDQQVALRKHIKSGHDGVLGSLCKTASKA